MNLIITRGFGPSAGLAGRTGPVTQGFGASAVFVPEVRTDWRWIEYARLRSIEGVDPMSLGVGVRTVNVVLANLGPAPAQRCDDSIHSGGSVDVPVARVSSGNAAANRVRTLRRKR